MPCDFDPSGRTPVDVVAAVFDLEPAPAATVSAQEIAEMIRKLRLARAEVHTLPNSAARLYGDAADAIDALTAKNQRLTDALNTTVQEATTAIDDRLKPEIERLTAENARLIGLGKYTMPPGAVDTLNAETGRLYATVAELSVRCDALQAENARLKRVACTERNATIVHEVCAVLADALPDHAGNAADGVRMLADENARLTSENTELRLQCLAHEGQAHAAYEAQKRAEAENARLTDLARTVAAIGDWVCAVDRDRFEDPLCPIDGRTGYVRLDRVRHIRDEARKVLGMDVGWSIWDAVQAKQELADFGQRYQPETYATDDRPLSEIVADLRAVVAASPEAQAGIAAYFAEQAEERWHDGTIDNAHRSQVQAAHAAAKDGD